MSRIAKHSSFVPSWLLTVALAAGLHGQGLLFLPPMLVSWLCMPAVVQWFYGMANADIRALPKK
jgi:hypothetical protein